MFENLKNHLAWRRALKLVRNRPVRPWHPDPSLRRVLLVLPAAEVDARPAWRFVNRLGLKPEFTLPVVPTGEIAYAPVEYLGRVVSLHASDLGRTGLPKKAFRQRVWEFDPDIALALTTPVNLPAAVLVGASPAAFRVGFSAPDIDPFFDLMVAGDGIEGGIRALEQSLSHIDPPLIAPHHKPPSGGGHAAW
jgi:hypothetical protein